MGQVLRNNYYLSRLTILIKEEYRRGGFCKDGVSTEKGLILKNIVETYFTQASAKEINIATRGLSESLVEIQKLNQLLFDVLSNEYKDFFSHQFSVLVQSKKILREHTAVLEPVIFGCPSQSFLLNFSVPWGSRKRDTVSYIFHPSDVTDQSFKA